MVDGLVLKGEVERAVGVLDEGIEDAGGGDEAGTLLLPGFGVTVAEGDDGDADRGGETQGDIPGVGPAEAERAVLRRKAVVGAAEAERESARGNAQVSVGVGVIAIGRVDGLSDERLVLGYRIANRRMYPNRCHRQGSCLGRSRARR